MRNHVEVFRQVGINDGTAPTDQPARFLDGIDRAAARAITIGSILEVCSEDRLQRKLGSAV